MDLKGRAVLLTGASRGIGLALARTFAARGAKLHLVARRFDPNIKSDLDQRGAESVRLWEKDLSIMTQVDELASALDGESIDVLVNNAGLLTGGLLEEQDPDAVDQMLMVNLHAVIRLTRRLLPGMLARGSGKVVNNASVSGKMFFPCASTYAASKAAVVAFTESLKQELRGTGVSTLLLITPGVKTAMYDEIKDLYGGHLDLSFMNSIPAEDWAEKVARAIEDDDDTLWPSGSTNIGVRFAHHWPGLFERLVRAKFKRS